ALYTLFSRDREMRKPEAWRAVCFFFSSRRRHTRSKRDWSSDVCSSDLSGAPRAADAPLRDLPQRAAHRFKSAREGVRALKHVTRSEERRVGKECRDRWAR